ncbi:hypothetical protein Tco_0941568 [Tanacetum coccineum]|uniref:DUF4283 domain-containing protein n=1 Tax=Tanacetum coccineum TaxID=301880 RepID=A0ABQ5DST1_9ASTR
MERGFLSSSKKDKVKEDALKEQSPGGLASQVKKIKGKVLGRDGKPLKSILKRTKVVTGSSPSSAATYVHVNDATVVDNSLSEQETFVVQDGVDNNKKTTKDTGLPKKKIENSDVVLPKHARDKVKSRYENTLVGYFMVLVVNGFGTSLGTRHMDDPSIINYSYKMAAFIAVKERRGKHIMLDAFTNSMCVESWGRISFVHALIEVSAESSLKTEVVMAIPNDEDDGHTKEVIRVEYEWIPPHCVDCKIFRHGLTQCPKRVIKAAPSASSSAAAHMNEKEEGFVEVKGRKNKRKKVNTKIDEIHFTKPKVKFYHEKTSSSKNTKVPSPVKSDLNTPLSNTFDVLNTVEEVVGDSSVKGMNPVDGADFHNQNVSKPIGNDSLKKDDEDKSDDDEVFMPDDNYTTLGDGGFSMEDDDLD